MTPADGENGIGLTDMELRIIALRILANNAAFAEDWLLWEDLPGLGEDTFDRLYEEVRKVGAWLIDGHAAAMERTYDIDGQHILEQVQQQ